MSLNAEKLNTILKEIASEFDIRNMKYRRTCSIFDKIFASYNNDQPIRLKLANSLKNRQMVLKRLRAITEAKISDRFVEETSINYKEGEAIDSSKFEAAEALSMLQIGMFLPEEYAARALLKLSSNKENKSVNSIGNIKYVNRLENTAVEALLYLSSQDNILTKKSFDISKDRETERYNTPETPTIQNESRHDELQMDTGVKEISKILDNFLKEFEKNCNNFIHKCNVQDENIFNKINNDEKSVFFQNSNKSVLIDCDNEILEKKILGPFEIEDNSFDLSRFESYRNNVNSKEKVNKIVVREPGKIFKPVRRFCNKIPDCKIEINPDLIFNSKDDGMLKLCRNKFVIDVIRESYKKQNNACILAFYNIKYLKSSVLAYGYCTFADCCNYRFKVHYNGTTFVYRTGKILHEQGRHRVSQIRGVSRHIVKQNIKDKSAYVFRKEKILEASDEIAESGNFQSIHNLSTLRKCKSEGNFDTFCDPNAFIDVYLMQQKLYKEYIQYLSSPLTIHCWAEKMFETFKENPQILNDANHTIHFDATGQSVRQIECAEKRILIYKMVIRIKKFKMVIPIVTAILSRHTMTDICLLFERLQIYCKERKYKWPFFERICTDVSYALFGGVLKICIGQSVSEYLDACFKHLENPKIISRPKVIVQWCKAHYVHIICKDLNNKIGKNNALRHLLKNALTLSFDLKTMDECKFWFRNIFTVLLSPQRDHEYKESYNILRKNIMEVDEKDVEDLNIFENEQINNLESIASRSPFKKLFENICNKLNQTFRDTAIKHEINEFKNEDICNFIIKKYCSFLPMWTNILGIEVDPSGDHISNAPVEFNFYLQKHILLNNKSVRPGDFIKIDRKDSMSSLKELRYKYNMFDINQKSEEKFNEEVQNIRNTALQIAKEHNYALLEYSDPKKTFKKKTLKSRKGFKPKCLLNEKKSEKVYEEHQNINNATQIAKEHDYELIEYLDPEETWKKKNLKAQKGFKPKHLLNAKKPKKFTSNSKSVEDIIQIDTENEMKKEDTLRISKEHTYPMTTKCKKLYSASEVVEKYFLFRYNYLFETVYPNLTLCSLGLWNILDLEDWKSLSSGNRLTNIVLDCALIAILKENFKNAISLPCQNDKISFEKIDKLLPYKPNYIIIPILSNFHFNLCILNFLKKEFIFIDSLSVKGGEKHFLNFSSNFSENKAWKFSQISKRKIQGDNVSCGVFVIMYTLYYLKGKSLLKLPSSDVFRKTIKTVLIRNADNCSEFCCHCGNFKRIKVKCKSCNYAVCEYCVKEIYKNNFIICKICTNEVLK